jgi:hypothetical protein
VRGACGLEKFGKTRDPIRHVFSLCADEGQERALSKIMKTTINIAIVLTLMTLLAGCIVTSVYPFLS